MIYRTRDAENTLTMYLSNFLIVIVTDPRQSGKSSMLRRFLRASYRYMMFDDFQTMTAFHDDPQKFMRLFGIPPIWKLSSIVMFASL